MFDPLLADGYIESYNAGTYPWLEGIKIEGFTWFEHEANLEISGMLSISDFENKLSVNIAPNPAKGYFEISEVNGGTYQLFTLQGILIQTNRTGKFDVSKLANGLYLVLTSKKEESQTNKIIVQN